MAKNLEGETFLCFYVFNSERGAAPQSPVPPKDATVLYHIDL